MVALFFNHLPKNGEAWLILQLLELLAVEGDGTAFVDLQAPQRHSLAANAVRKSIRVAGHLAMVSGLRPAKLKNPLLPQRGMICLGLSHVPQRLFTQRVVVALREGAIGVIAAHLCLPI